MQKHFNSVHACVMRKQVDAESPSSCWCLEQRRLGFHTRAGFADHYLRISSQSNAGQHDLRRQELREDHVPDHDLYVSDSDQA
jgi:hypothetical protein